MKAHSTTTTTRSRPKRIALVLAIGACSLAIPTTATAMLADPPTGYSSVTAITGGESDSAQPAGGADYSSVTAITGPPSSEPTLVSSTPAPADDGFDWASAAIGAGAAMAFATLGAVALLSVRRRTAVSPSAAATS